MSENISARDEEVGKYAIERETPTIVVTKGAKHTDFVHLHNHTEFSLLDGASRIDQMVARASELGQKALALTDHGVMYGAIPFYKACKKAGIKPIVGYEAYVAPRGLAEKDPKLDVNPNHLTLLAGNHEGYVNLMKLSTIGHLEGFYYKPRIDLEVLAAHSKGVIALSGCLAGEVASRIVEGNDEGARAAIGRYKEIFGDRYFLEVQRHGIPDQERVVAALARYAGEFDLKMVATNDSHYTKKTDADAHDILLCLQTGSRFYDPKRWRFDSDSFYLSDGDEMSRIFSDLPMSLRNTLDVAEMTDLTIELDATKSHLPRIPLPEGVSAEEQLTNQVNEGFKKRYPQPTQEHLDRLTEEMTVITQMGYASYFIIVSDFINFAKRSDIPVGPGRGSAAGSIVAYSLGITALDPIEHGLLFERFLNKDRISMPDIDTDFSVAGREKVISYIAERYGREYVAQIATMGTMASRAAIRDVSRVLEVPLKVADVMAKLIPVERGAGWALNKVITDVPEIRDAFNGTMRQDKLREVFGEGVNAETIQRVFKTAIQLEGISRSVGKHAAGVVIGDQPLVNYTPLQLDKDKTNHITQYDMTVIEELGLLKMDLLGLQNLDILAGALKIIKLERGLDLDLEKIPADDKMTMEMIAAGDTLGTFQLAGDGMKRMLMEMKPENFADITAAIALFRPGPMINIPQYVARKHGREEIVYPHPALEGLLKETYGIMIYQEQVMQAARILAGYSLSQADLLRKIMGKKKAEAMAEEKGKFVAGCKANKINEQDAGKLFDTIAKFADYGFNKCVAGSTVITHAETGERVTIQDFFEHRRPFQVHSLGDDWKLHSRPVTDVVYNGRKPIFDLTTQSGRKLRATATHRVRTLGGWWPLGELAVGDMIALPRQLPVTGSKQWPAHETTLLAALLTEGNLCHPGTLYVYSGNETYLAEVAEAANHFPGTRARIQYRAVRPGRCGEVVINGGARGLKTRCGAYKWAASLGITGKKAPEKRVPSEVFHFDENGLALFLGRLWAGDGCIADAAPRTPSYYYATSSEGLARDVQHLLLRLGVNSTLFKKQFKNQTGKTFSGYTVNVQGEDSAATFLSRIAIHATGKQEVVGALRERSRITQPGPSTRDLIPSAIYAMVVEQCAEQGLAHTLACSMSGLSTRTLQKPRSDKVGYQRSTIKQLGVTLQSPDMLALARSDVYWDRVVSIVGAGEEDTYDLTVDTDHNFVADDIIVHNSHSAAYAVLSYQTSYLKANYRLEYMAAVLAQAAGDIDKTAAAINDCRSHGIEVKAPDVNSSHATHWVDGPAIRFGFDAIKNLGEKAAQAIVEERNSNGPYTSLYDLASRTLTLESRAVNKNAVQALVVCGACDGFAERARLAASVDAICEMVRKQKAKAAKINKNQMGLDLFATADGVKAPKFDPELPAPANTPALDPIERLKWERDSLGIYVTGHPVEIIAKDLRRLTDGPLSVVQPEHKGKTVRVGGLVNTVRKIITKKGDPMAFVEIEDQTGRVELTVFPRTMKEFGHVFVEDTVVLIEGKVELERQRPGAAESGEEGEIAPKAQLIVDAAYSWQEASKLTERPKRDVHVDLVGVSDEAMDLLLKAAKNHPGGDRLFLLTRANGHDIKIESELRVSADDPFLLDLREAIGLNVAVESMQATEVRRESSFELVN